MIRRPPTRIEMKLDDIQEYEKAKKEADARKAKAGKDAAAASGSGAAAAAAAKTRKEIIHERIGFDPTPKSSS